MPQLGPAFLHRPISGASFSSLTKAAQWLLDGALSLVPRNFRSAGWKANSLLFEFTDQLEPTPIGVIEKSWAGESRLLKACDAAGELPVTIALNPSFIFNTSVDLPEAARGSLQKTIALRMADICPIPQEDAAFAIGAVEKRGTRLHVGVAIIRKQTLRTIERAFSGKQIAAIGTAPDDNNSMLYNFTTDESTKHRGTQKWLITGVAFWASALLLAGAYEAHLNKELAALDAHQTRLRQDLHEIHRVKENFTRIKPFAPHEFTLGEASRAITEHVNALPQGAIIAAITIKDDWISITGMTPTDAQTVETDLSRTASDYPGFDRFNLNASIIDASEEIEAQ